MGRNLRHGFRRGRLSGNRIEVWSPLGRQWATASCSPRWSCPTHRRSLEARGLQWVRLATPSLSICPQSI